MERRSRGIIQRAKDTFGRLKAPKEQPVRAKSWVQHGNHALWTLEEGAIIPYRPVQSLEQVCETLERLNCANVTKVLDGDQITAVEWIIDYECAVLGIGRQGDIIPHTLVFSVDEQSDIKFACRIGLKEFETDKNGMLPNTLNWSRDPNELFTQAGAIYYFLFPFAQEAHAELAPTDSFNFQFEGTEDNDTDVGVRIGGVKFRFIPSMLPNSIINGIVKIEVPDF